MSKPWRDRLTVSDRLQAAVRRSLIAGVPVEVAGPRSFRLGWMPKCDNPYHWDATASVDVRHKRSPYYVDGFGRCRKCPSCRKARSQMWQIRAMHEFNRWPISLFGTVTMSLDQHYQQDALIMAGIRASDGSWRRPPRNLRELSPSELFRARVQVFGDEMQRYLKRLRKGDRHHKPLRNIRYLLVAEAHDGPRTDARLRNRPHFHLMLHEMQAGCLVVGNPREALINGSSGEYVSCQYKAGNEWRTGVFVHDDAFMRLQWHFGFTKFQWAESAKAAAYLCKYLTKASDDRVRASLHYGEIEDEPFNYADEALRRCQLAAEQKIDPPPRETIKEGMD